MTVPLVLGIEDFENNPPTTIATIDASSTRHHTLIVGQSGSGKSNFLTRYVEEIVLRTGGRVILLDPNGDYGQISRIHDPVWEEDSIQRLSELSTRANIETLDESDSFSSKWFGTNFQYVGNWISAPDDTAQQGRISRAKLTVSWMYLTQADKALLLNVDPVTHPKLYAATRVLDDHLYETFRQGGSKYRLDDLSALARAIASDRTKSMPVTPDWDQFDSTDWMAAYSRFDELIRRFGIWASEDEVAPPVRVIVENGLEQKSSCWTLCVVGLATPPTHDEVTHEDSLLAADEVLSKVWRCALSGANSARQGAAKDPPVPDARVPIYVVIDEAQLFAPSAVSSPLQGRVREKIERLAAEGRKYGLVLVLSTQRPSKLSPAIVYECENHATLRIQSPVELDYAERAFGIKSDFLKKVPKYRKQGQTLLTGRWCGETPAGIDAREFRVSLARSRPGGADLRTEAWLDPAEYRDHPSRRPRTP